MARSPGKMDYFAIELLLCDRVSPLALNSKVWTEIIFVLWLF